ncbi:MAG: hypothetical protein HC903_17155 [Methylacidiphilales bacterium]|nr:hypothetical protein [Candidatus Methylacidiphilales bacterium]NJR14640.1 hypothetical protein [Calothrix sp. CSU_2_0]
MKTRLIKFVTVSLVTLVILSPEILVLGVVWQNHLGLEQINEKTNFLISSDNAYQASNPQYDYLNNTWINQNNVESEKHEYLDLLDTFKIIFLLELLLFCLPIGLGLIFFLYERYRMHHHISYQKQIELLEKVWQYNIEQKGK